MFLQFILIGLRDTTGVFRAKSKSPFYMGHWCNDAAFMQHLTYVRGAQCDIYTNFKISVTKWVHRRIQICNGPWWRHQMETFSALLALVPGIHRSPVNFAHKGQWRGTLMFSLICASINGWVNSRKAGDLRRHLAHYDVTIMHYRNL